MVFRNLARPLVLGIADARPQLRAGRAASTAAALAAEECSTVPRSSGQPLAPSGGSSPQYASESPDRAAGGDRPGSGSRSEPEHTPASLSSEKSPPQTWASVKQGGDAVSAPRQKMPRGNTHRPANHTAGTEASTSSRGRPPSSTSKTGSIPRSPCGTPATSSTAPPSSQAPSVPGAPWSKRAPSPRTAYSVLPAGNRSPVVIRRSAKASRPPTLVHAAVKQPRARMTAKELVDLVYNKPHLATRSTTAALYEYAVRTSDWRAQKNAWDLLPKERLPSLPPLRWATVQHEVRDTWDKVLNGGEATADGDKVEATPDAKKVATSTTPAKSSASASAPASLSSRPGTSAASLSTSSRNTSLALPTEPVPHKRIEALRALAYRHPPLPELPDTKATAAEVLRHLHYLHLTRQPWSLSGSLAAVRGAGGTLADEAHVLNLALAYAHTSATPLPEDSYPQPHYEVRYTYKGRPMNPYLNRIVYAPKDVDPIPIITEFCKLSLAHLGRATLGQAVQLRLLARTTLSDLNDLLALFPVPPGPETWRHVALHALITDDEPLAHEAFLGAKRALAVERFAISKYEEDERKAWDAWVEGGGRKSTAESGSKSGAHATLAAKLNAAPIANTKPPPLAPPIDPRFAHLGTHLTRWERTLNHLRKRGWVTRRDDRDARDAHALPSSTPSLIRRWVWLGRRGEQGAAERYAAFTRALERDILARGGERALEKARNRWGYTAEQVAAHKKKEPWRLWDQARRPGIGWRPVRPWDDEGVHAHARRAPRYGRSYRPKADDVDEPVGDADMRVRQPPRK